MKFILSRNRDYENHSKKWMVGYAVLFWVISRVIVMILMGLSMAIYDHLGINPKELTDFGGDPTVTKASGSIVRGLLIIALMAPVFEEFLFRFGLSFKRYAVAVSCACIGLFPAFSHNKTATLSTWLICICMAIVFFTLIYYTTTNNFWSEKKSRWQVPAMWITSIAFGLVHLIAFSTLSWMLLPYALIVSLAPFFAGCSCSYLRVNMGFGWSIGMHILNNLPGIVIMLV